MIINIWAKALKTRISVFEILVFCFIGISYKMTADRHKVFRVLDGVYFY